MNNLTSSQKKHLNSLGVRAVILFGSRALGLARPASDFDIGVILKNPAPLFSVDYRKRQEIYDALYEIFSSNIRELLNIDIVFLQKAPAELRSHVARHGVVLYQNSPKVFADFREAIMNEYADFEPSRNLFHQAILARIA